MKRYSFRIKIVGSIIIVVCLCSIISFTLFNVFLKEKLLDKTEKTLNTINLLKNKDYFAVNQRDESVRETMMKDFGNADDILRVFLIDSNLKVVYPKSHSFIVNDTGILRDLDWQKKDVAVRSYSNLQIPFNRVFVKIKNSPVCCNCHKPSSKNLGMVVLDVSDDETQEIIVFTRQFSWLFTIFILLIIFILIAYLHFKFIRKPIKHFRSTIRAINQGRLIERLEISETRELGSLGRDFNEMLDNFEKTQKELRLYHHKELQNAQKLATIGEMTARIAHEIRNPITGIARALEIIVAEMKDSDNKPILEEIQRQANRVNLAISNMLKFSRSKELKMELADINELIKSLVFFLKNQAHDKVINFELDLHNIPQFAFDTELIENVLLNLSFNAIQSISAEGELKYTSNLDVTGEFVVISVSDNGGGISPEVGEEIYKPFYTTRTKGTGLGLAISKDIIQKHRGELWYENIPGSGCAFFISIPK